VGRVHKAAFLLGVVTAFLGCYSPEVRDCTVKCSAKTDCAGSQECRDGFCVMPGASKCPKDGSGTNSDNGGTMVDAATVTNPDALDLCPLGCTNGTCMAGVCVIDCSANDACQGEVQCSANLPCRVICGDHACAKPIKCGLATSCEVKCTGDFSCADEIQCNANRCDVDCTGASSCKRRTRCMSSCACDVSCTGLSSCVEVSECPSTTCRLGNGCSAQLAGCDDC
jgi:hypothetical protein